MRVGLSPGKAGPAVAPATIFEVTGMPTRMITQGHHGDPDRRSGSPGLYLSHRAPKRGSPATYQPGLRSRRYMPARYISASSPVRSASPASLPRSSKRSVAQGLGLGFGQVASKTISRPSQVERGHGAVAQARMTRSCPAAGLRARPGRHGRGPSRPAGTVGCPPRRPAPRTRCQSGPGPGSNPPASGEGTTQSSTSGLIAR